MLKPRARKKHQPLGFSILKFQSSHPPQKNKQIKHKIQGSVIFSLSRGEPPPKKTPLAHSSTHLLCLWKSAWKGPFPQQKSRWTKRGSNEKNNYSNPLSNHWKQKRSSDWFLLISIFWYIFFVPNQNSNSNSLSSGRKSWCWTLPLATPSTSHPGYWLVSTTRCLSVRIVTFFVGNPELNNYTFICHWHPGWG